MFEGLFQPMHLLVIAFIALLVFGPKKLPELGKGLGDGIRAFKDGMQASTIASMRFTRTSDKLPENPAPNAAPGEFPFDVFPQADLEWNKHVIKPINTPGKK